MKLRKQEKQPEKSKKFVTRTEMLMFCLAARAHDGRGNLIWQTLPWN